MARAIVAQVKGIVEDNQQELKKLTTIIKGDPELDFAHRQHMCGKWIPAFAGVTALRRVDFLNVTA